MLRPLYPSEAEIAFRVFKTSLCVGQIYVSPAVGLQSRPFTTTIPPFSPNPGIAASYVINIGLNGFIRGMTSTVDQRATLVHELTHVWQGAHGLICSDFMYESVTHQVIGWIQGTDPYAYRPGLPWDDYNVEQQAQIVEEWFKRGERTSDPLYPYIRDHIRTLLWFG